MSRGSRVTPFEASWTVLNVRPAAPRGTCCNNCNPDLLAQPQFQPISLDDRRLFTYSGDFLFPAMQPPDRPVSRASNISNASAVSANSFLPVRGNFIVDKESKESLQAALDEWSKRRHEKRGGGKFVSCHIALPPKCVEKIISSAAGFLRMREVTTDTLLKTIKLDLLLPAEVEEVAHIISDWRSEATVLETPHHKKQRSALQPSTPISQPNFVAGPLKGTTNSMPLHPGKY